MPTTTSWRNPETSRGVERQGRTLERLVAHSKRLQAIDKNDLQCGDRVVVRTRNSIYSLLLLGGNEYYVSGGWFDRKGLSPLRTTVNGCTWGGCAIKLDLVAARGLFLEFGNLVTTTSIQEFQVIRLPQDPTLH